MTRECNSPQFLFIDQHFHVGRVDPTSVNVLVRNETKCPESSSVVRAFIPHVLPMTVVSLHGDTQLQLGLEQQLLTGRAQRNIHACLYHSHTNVTSML